MVQVEVFFSSDNQLVMTPYFFSVMILCNRKPLSELSYVCVLTTTESRMNICTRKMHLHPHTH